MTTPLIGAFLAPLAGDGVFHIHPLNFSLRTFTPFPRVPQGLYRVAFSLAEDTPMRQVEVSPSRPIRSQRSTSSLQLRGKYVSGACSRCKNLKMKCERERGASSCRRCQNAGIDCIFLGRKPRYTGTASSDSNRSRSRSSSNNSASPRNHGRLNLDRLSESEEDEYVARTAAARFSLAEYPIHAPEEPISDQVCIACGACEMVDDGWMIPQHFGVKTYVPIALSPLCPICSSNTHEFRGRLPRPSNAPSSSYRVQIASNHTQGTTTLQTETSSVAEKNTTPPPYSLTAYPGDHPSPAFVPSQYSTTPQIVDSSEKTPCWTTVLWSVAALLARLTQTLHLLCMLWIPRYYENQIRQGALRFEGSRLGNIGHASSVEDAALEQTEGGRGFTGTEDEETVMKVRALWLDFVETRIFEWNILISITLVLIAASPTIFQIPSASDDRLIRTLTFLSISRAVSGLTFGIILSLHFRSPLTKSVAYIRSWSLESRKTNSSLFGFWVVVSLPASSTVWSLILFVSAIFGLVWRTDALHNEEAGSLLTPRAETIIGSGTSHSSISILRPLITALFLIDLAYAFWALSFLQKRTRTCLESEVDI